MKKINCFILGIITYICFIPIIESITELFCGFIETLKVENTKKVMIGNNEIADLQAQLEPQNTNCIGFEIPSEDYYDDDWEEDKVKK